VSGADIGDTFPRPMNAAVRALVADLKTKKANAQVNRRQCEALTSELNLQLGFHASRCDAHCAKETPEKVGCTSIQSLKKCSSVTTT